LVPAVVAAGYLERGELVPVLPHLLRIEGRVALVYPERDLVPAQVRAFIDWMAARMPPFFQSDLAPGEQSSEGRSATRRPRIERKRPRT
jgi:hypothetical protein